MKQLSEVFLPLQVQELVKRRFGSNVNFERTVFENAIEPKSVVLQNVYNLPFS